MSDAISLLASSPGLDRAAIEIVVTLPTFRRPGPLLATLASLRAQETTRRFAVIVMENDAEGGEGAAAARPLFETGEVPGLLIVAHDRGNCFAYNAGWVTALSEFPAAWAIAVIDDDETAPAHWLDRLAAAAERHDADAVGGPQTPVFPDGTDPRWARHPVFAPPYAASGPVAALYSSGNLLVRRRLLERMPRPFLDPMFNFIGGGDADFLSRSVAAGARLAWCAEAAVAETVPPRRLEADWIRARAQRNGMISTLVERRRRVGQPAGRLLTFAHSLALAAAAGPRALLRLAGNRWPADAAYPLQVAAGRLMAEFGRLHEQYRQPEKN